MYMVCAVLNISDVYVCGMMCYVIQVCIVYGLCMYVRGMYYVCGVWYCGVFVFDVCVFGMWYGMCVCSVLCMCV